MTPTRAQKDETLRQYALDNLRASLSRLRSGDALLELPVSPGRESWREHYLNRAAKWATIAEALRPPEPTVVGGRTWDGRIAMDDAIRDLPEEG